MLSKQIERELTSVLLDKMLFHKDKILNGHYDLMLEEIFENLIISELIIIEEDILKLANFLCDKLASILSLYDLDVNLDLLLTTIIGKLQSIIKWTQHECSICSNLFYRANYIQDICPDCHHIKAQNINNFLIDITKAHREINDAYSILETTLNCSSLLYTQNYIENFVQTVSNILENLSDGKYSKANGKLSNLDSILHPAPVPKVTSESENSPFLNINN